MMSHQLQAVSRIYLAWRIAFRNLMTSCLVSRETKRIPLLNWLLRARENFCHKGIHQKFQTNLPLTRAILRARASLAPITSMTIRPRRSSNNSSETADKYKLAVSSRCSERAEHCRRDCLRINEKLLTANYYIITSQVN